MKKLISMLLAVIMVVAMAVPAFAAVVATVYVTAPSCTCGTDCGAHLEVTREYISIFGTKTETVEVKAGTKSFGHCVSLTVKAVDGSCGSSFVSYQIKKEYLVRPDETSTSGDKTYTLSDSDGASDVYITASYTKPTSYTVTYTDGVEDEVVFADQSHTVLKDRATPAFNGTPEREGYSFEGWSPVVAETVTADVIYVAQWNHIACMDHLEDVRVITEPTCTEKGEKLCRCTVCSKEFRVELPALGHDWAAATYEWTEVEGGYECTAKRVCNNDASHVETETVKATYEVLNAPKCLKEGTGRYTATFTADWAETRTKDIVLKATGHDWAAATYEWTEVEGGYECTAKRVCNNDASHVETETVKATYAVVTEPKCLTDGLGRYTATFAADWAETRTKDIVLKATGHDWAAATYEWTEVEGGYECTAKRVCKNDASHVETETVKATYAVVTEPKCLTDGLGRYTATFTADWAETQTKDIVLKATGHDWAAATYEWKEVEGGYECTAKRVCNNDASHVETETVKATYAVVTEPKCLTDGLGRYTATFTADWAETQTKDIVLKALGHDHSGKWIYNREDHWKKCTRCSEILDLHEHDFTDWTFEYKSKTEKYRDCKVCGYHQEASVINIGGNTVVKPNTETNPNTGAEAPSVLPAIAVLAGVAALLGKRK